MTAGSIHVVRPGLLTTVQDGGRWGFQALGVPVAGPMDPFAHRLANALAGNPRTAAILEITIVGPELEFDDERVVAVTGARFIITIDGRAVAPNRAFVVSPGSRVQFGERQAGARAYLAVGGGIDAPAVLGSRATHVPSGMGGWQGRALARGDRLPLGPTTSRPFALSDTRSDGLQPDDGGPARSGHDADPSRIRVLAGPDRHRFAAGALETLASDSYRVSADSDRMGFRLSGPRLAHAHGADIVSDPTPLGTLQVPASGQPLLLMADRPTSGGYARIATVISADVGIAGQAVPGDRLAFDVVTPAEAIRALIAREQRMLALESSGS